MAVYLFERVNVVPGQTAEYIRGFAERWLPLSDKYDTDLYALSGFFTPDVLYNTQPAVNILWTLGSWETWDGRHRRGDAQERLIKTHEFYIPAIGWRSGWTDKMFESLPFSPEPPVRPATARAGTVLLAHSFTVRPDGCADFVRAMEHEVVPAAEKAGLKLELFGRAIGHPVEYLALWTVPVGSAYVEWRTRPDRMDVHGILPGFANAWSTLVDVSEQEMTPTWFSPLGGSQVNPKQPTEEHMSV